MPRNEGIFKTAWVDGTPVLPSEDVTGFPILGYSVYQQHINKDHADVNIWVRLPEDAHKKELKARLDFVKDYGEDDAKEEERE